MELDERKEKILKAIIQTYLETGEPVGSRTISKYSDLNLSSATIRNEMSDLEELGYIIQPHTSAGRIPSDKGYRFYVDQIIREKDDEVTEIKDLMIQRVDRVELLLKQLATILAANTNYATMISGPQYHQTKIKFIQLSRMEAGKLLIVTVLEGNIIKNSMVDLDGELSEEELLNLKGEYQRSVENSKRGAFKRLHAAYKRKCRREKRMAKGQMLCADGKPVMFGETLYGGDGRDWLIVGIAGEWSYDVYGLHVAHDGKKEKKPLRAEWLVHELTDAGKEV